jgi:hypothetical protein
LQATEAQIGRTASCPGCAALHVVPATGEPEEVEIHLAPQASTSPTPAAKGKPARPTEPARPRGWKPSRTSALAVGAALLLIGGLIAAWFAFLRPRGLDDEDLRLIPTDARDLIVFDVAELNKSEAGRKVLEPLRRTTRLGRTLEELVGLSLQDLRRVTWTGWADSGQGVVIVSANQDIPRNQVLNRLGSATEVPGWPYYRGNSGLAAYFLGRRVVVLGQESEVRKLLGATRPRAGGLTSALDEVRRRQFPLLLAGEERGERGKAIWRIGVVLAQDAEVTIDFGFDDEAAAKALKTSVDGARTFPELAGRQLVRQFGEMTHRELTEEDLQAARPAATELVKNMTARQEGRAVNLRSRLAAEGMATIVGLVLGRGDIRAIPWRNERERP